MLALWLISLQAVDVAEASALNSPVNLNVYRAVAWYHDPIRIAYAVVATTIVAMIAALVFRGESIIRE